MSKKNTRKKYGTGNDELDEALAQDKIVTAYWYHRISGQVPWMPGEREVVNRMMDAAAARVRSLMSKDVIGGSMDEPRETTAEREAWLDAIARDDQREQRREQRREQETRTVLKGEHDD